jgi:hypothetical protein
MKNQRQLFKPKQSLLQKDKPLQFFLVNLKKNRNFAKSTDMNHKKYNYDEPVELSATNEPVLAYGYAQDTHSYTPEPTKNIREQRILEPDDDFRRAITGDELMKRMRVSIREIFAAGKQ